MPRNIKIPFKSNVLTKNGYINVESLAKKRKFLESEEIINFKLINKDNKLITVKFITDSTNDIYEITTVTGNKLFVEKNTKIKILDKSGNLIIKEVQELKENDIVISKFSDNISSKKELVSIDNAYLLGYLYSLNFSEIIKTNEKYIEIKTEDSDVFNYLKEILFNKFDVCIENNKLFIYNSDISINNYILGNNFNQNKIPTFILESSIEVQSAFLRGFYDVNTIFKDNTLIKNITSENLFNELLLLMKNIGIIVEKNDLFTIKGAHILNFYNLIGFYNSNYESNLWNFTLKVEDFCVISEIQETVKKYIDENNLEEFKNIELNKFNIKKLLEMTESNDLKNIIEELIQDNYFYDKIISIEKHLNENCLTLEVNDNETIISDSIII